ncbi:MAG: hypothetical protein QG650_295 [Patescibacteria group bacterium]|nr:hypothetical protein [Patescibacteria group bacterium]
MFEPPSGFSKASPYFLEFREQILCRLGRLSEFVADQSYLIACAFEGRRYPPGSSIRGFYLFGRFDDLSMEILRDFENLDDNSSAFDVSKFEISCQEMVLSAGKQPLENGKIFWNGHLGRTGFSRRHVTIIGNKMDSTL